MIESQVNYIVDALRTMRREGLGAVEVKPAAQATSNAWIRKRMETTVWSTGGCKSWYLDANGNNVTLWPDFTFRYRAKTRRFDRANYDVEPLRVGGPADAPARETVAV
jgi:hypothetical protein